MIKRVNKRTIFLSGLLSFMFVVLIARVFQVQVVQGGTYLALAKQTWAKDNVIAANRGMITDKNNKPLAMNVNAYNLSLQPQRIYHLHLQDEIVEKLSLLLGSSEAYLNGLISKKKSDGNYFVQVEVRNGGWLLDSGMDDKLVKLKAALQKEKSTSDVGMVIEQADKRFYPDNSLASQLLGYVNKEGVPIMGLEKSLDKELKQTDGRIIAYQDGSSIELPNGTISYQKPVNGKNITLTIDEQIQFYVEDALRGLQAKYNPKSASVIVADPNTMDILALANIPSFNPNAFWEKANDLSAFYNHAIRSEYEPGSTFKIVTLAAAVQEGLFDPNEKYRSGSIKVPGRTIHDINPQGWGTITFLEGLKRSSNVEFVKLGYEKLKPAKLEQYIRNFGFGSPTGIELPGESKGVITMKYPSDFAAASYGQGEVQVTPIQQIAAISAIANGGKLMQPHLVKKIEDPQEGNVVTSKPTVVRQVISKETATKVGQYLEQVVSDRVIGSGRYAYMNGYTVAGKTGTANKVENGEYAEGKHVVSFIGYAPVSDPKLAIIVIVDEPNSEVDGGGVVAAPVFKQIMMNSLKYLKIPEDRKEQQPTDEGNQQLVTMPSYLGKGIQELNKNGLMVKTIGSGKKVIFQYPTAGVKINKLAPIYLFTDQTINQTPPDLTGLPLIDALSIARILKFELNVSGEGFVVSQRFDPKTKSLSVVLDTELKSSLTKQ
ncbi:penicillin-binding transpeptidase domain-containing protein [Paenibacillus sacheonensis]|uniref:Stage V sporulation protein D n=1 Tax=Paenibacillus sacheonensis TaxID=742054 RepID=A0A7X5BXF8_9BACL|nr:penicillin-binding transpeptidase domain-containing protein [Paenibacillus sacheonensis]NBC70458.1 stage V sporulation protein D [Paenibacillus sacheonensis]